MKFQAFRWLKFGDKIMTANTLQNTCVRSEEQSSLDRAFYIQQMQESIEAMEKPFSPQLIKEKLKLVVAHNVNWENELGLLLLNNLHFPEVAARINREWIRLAL